MLAAVLLAGCAVKPRTEVVRATIEESNNQIGVTKRIARVMFEVYNCKDMQALTDEASIRAWLEKNAHCYHDGEELPLDTFILLQEGKDKKHTVYAEFLISSVEYGKPHEGEVGTLNFVFDLKGFEMSYDGEFTNKIE